MTRCNSHDTTSMLQYRVTSTHSTREQVSKTRTTSRISCYIETLIYIYFHYPRHATREQWQPEWPVVTVAPRFVCLQIIWIFMMNNLWEKGKKISRWLSTNLCAFAIVSTPKILWPIQLIVNNNKSTDLTQVKWDANWSNHKIAHTGNDLNN